MEKQLPSFKELKEMMEKHRRKREENSKNNPVLNEKIVKILQNKTRRPDPESMALLSAARGGNLKIFKMLYNRPGVNKQVKDEHEMTSLMLAAFMGHVDIVKFLLEQPETDVNEADMFEHTPLLNSAMSGQLEIVTMLWEHPNIDKEKMGVTGTNALMMAANRGHDEIVDFLLRQPEVPLNVTDEDGDTALLHAAMGGYLETFKKIYNHPKVNKSVRNKNNVNVLMMASNQGKADVVKFLLTQPEALAELNDADDKEHTALYHAAIGGNLETFLALYNQPGVRRDLRDIIGTNLLMVASLKNGVKVVEFLLEQEETDVSARDHVGHTALHYAALGGSLQVLKILMDHPKVDNDATDNDGLNALATAAQSGSQNVVKFLLGIPDDTDDDPDPDPSDDAPGRKKPKTTGQLLKLLSRYTEKRKMGQNNPAAFKKPWAIDVGAPGPGPSTSAAAVASTSAAQFNPFAVAHAPNPGVDAMRKMVHDIMVDFLGFTDLASQELPDLGVGLLSPDVLLPGTTATAAACLAAGGPEATQTQPEVTMSSGTDANATETTNEDATPETCGSSLNLTPPPSTGSSRQQSESEAAMDDPSDVSTKKTSKGKKGRSARQFVKRSQALPVPSSSKPKVTAQSIGKSDKLFPAPPEDTTEADDVTGTGSPTKRRRMSSTESGNSTAQGRRVSARVASVAPLPPVGVSTRRRKAAAAAGDQGGGQQVAPLAARTRRQGAATRAATATVTTATAAEAEAANAETEKTAEKNKTDDGKTQ